MRLALTLKSSLVAAFCVLGTSQTLNAASFGVIGNLVEMYADEVLCSGQVCTIDFPQNLTGKVVVVRRVSCQATTGGGEIYQAQYGPVTSPQSSMLLKRDSFDTIHTVVANSAYYSNLTASPQMFLGVSRYLRVQVAKSGSAGGTILSCSAAGNLAP